MGFFTGFFDKIKSIFQGKSKKIKFFALMFVIVVLLYLAVSPLPANDVTVSEVGVFNTFSSSLKGAAKRVRFAQNPVTQVWRY